MQADTFDQLAEIILDLAPDLLRANVGLPVGSRVNITIAAERRATVTVAA